MCKHRRALLWIVLWTAGLSTREALPSKLWSEASLTDDGHSQAPGCKRTAWFMALEVDSGSSLHDLQVALLSAKRHAPSLYPVLLVYGSPTPLTAWFERSGGTVVHAPLSFYDLLPVDQYAAGAWMRLDVPGVMARMHLPPDVDTEHVLYTDTDVMFYRDFSACSLPRPAVLAIGPEFFPGNKTNTGVLYMNVAAMVKRMSGFLDWAKSVGFSWPELGPWDQGCILKYFGDQADLLPDIYNWKGYWGANDEAVILHFHGPKPHTWLPCLMSAPGLRGPPCDVMPGLMLETYERAGDNGTYYFTALQDYWQFRHQAQLP